MPSKGCWEAVIGYADDPGVMPDEIEVRRRHRNNLTALTIIMRTVSDELINDIMDFELTDEAWTALEGISYKNSLYGAMVKLKDLAL